MMSREEWETRVSRRFICKLGVPFDHAASDASAMADSMAEVLGGNFHAPEVFVDAYLLGLNQAVDFMTDYPIEA